MGQCVDAQLGRKIRHGRWMLGLGQERLAEQIGVPVVELQGYEAGTQPVSATRLQQIALVLEMPVTYFFEGLEGRPDEPGEAGSEAMSGEEALALVRNYLMHSYYAMSEAERRSLTHLGDLVEALAHPPKNVNTGAA